jgi:hypothetical protein
LAIVQLRLPTVADPKWFSPLATQYTPMLPVSLRALVRVTVTELPAWGVNSPDRRLDTEGRVS